MLTIFAIYNTDILLIKNIILSVFGLCNGTAGHCPLLYTLARKTSPCLDCKTVRSLGKLGSLRREHDYCTTLQLISALTRNSYSICMPDSRVSVLIGPTAVQSWAIVRLFPFIPVSSRFLALPPPSRPPAGCLSRHSLWRRRMPGDTVPSLYARHLHERICQSDTVRCCTRWRVRPAAVSTAGQ